MEKHKQLIITHEIVILDELCAIKNYVYHYKK